VSLLAEFSISEICVRKPPETGCVCTETGLNVAVGLCHEAPALPVTGPGRSLASRSIDNCLGGFFLHK
jgi:hypothetical protein